MNKKLPLGYILLITVIVGVMHYAGTYLYLYWRLDNYDKLVHFFGGFLMVFICLTILYFKKMPFVRMSQILLVGIVASLAIGIAWEIFELAAHVTSLSSPTYWWDNGGDVAVDLIGGLIAAFSFNRRYSSKQIQS